MADAVSGIPRLNYFNSQLLDETDFETEQHYHREMRRRHNRLAHTWGVAGSTGLLVTKSGDKRLTVSAGMAIDKDGREIVLTEDQALTLEPAKTKADATLFLTLVYDEIPELPVQDIANSPSNFRRTVECAKFGFRDKKPPDDGSVLSLATIKLDGNGNIAEIDPSVRTFIGSVIDPRSELLVRELSVTTDANIDASLSVTGPANLRGSLNVAGGVSMNGPVGLGTSKPEAGLEINKGGSNELALKLTSSGPGFGSGMILHNTAPTGHKYGLYSSGGGSLVLDDQTVAGNAKVLLTADAGGKLALNALTSIAPPAEGNAAGLVIDRGTANAAALELVSSGPGFGSGMLLSNTAGNGHRYALRSGPDGAFVMSDETPNKVKIIWLVNADGQMQFHAPMHVFAGNAGTSGLVIERGNVRQYGLTIRSTQEFGAGLQLQNTGGGRIYGIYSRPNGELIIGDETNTRPVLTADVEGNIRGRLVNTSSRSVKKDLSTLEPKDYAEILHRLVETPLFRYHYQEERDNHPLHLGVIAEEAPEDIVDEKRQHVIVLDYLGFLFAALKAQAQEVEKLQERVARMEKTGASSA